VNLAKRTALTVRSGWIPVRAININAIYSRGMNDAQETTDQRYNLSWTPGPKLFLSVTYNSNEAVGQRKITHAGMNLQYRPHRKLRLFASGSRGEEALVGMPVVETTSFRAGLSLTL
jgi:hypothetical protein